LSFRYALFFEVEALDDLAHLIGYRAIGDLIVLGAAHGCSSRSDTGGEIYWLIWRSLVRVMSVQAQFWQEMVSLKRDARYVDLCLARTERIDRFIKGFLAIAASSSIAGWAIVQTYAAVWATIVAVSQVLQVVKDHLPYKNRLKALAALSVDLNALSLLAEDQWFKVSNGAGMYDDDIHDLRIGLKQKKLKAVQKAFPIAGLPTINRLTKRADEETVQYFSTYLAGES
jgi:hypothetical protein